MRRFHGETFTKNGPVPASATITVRVQATDALATIYDAETGDPKANPFTTTTGMIAFAAPNGTYRVTVDDGAAPAYDLNHLIIRE